MAISTNAVIGRPLNLPPFKLKAQVLRDLQTSPDRMFLHETMRTKSGGRLLSCLLEAPLRDRAEIIKIQDAVSALISGAGMAGKIGKLLSNVRIGAVPPDEIPFEGTRDNYNRTRWWVCWGDVALPPDKYLDALKVFLTAANAIGEKLEPGSSSLLRELKTNLRISGEGHPLKELSDILSGTKISIEYSLLDERFSVRTSDPDRGAVSFCRPGKDEDEGSREVAGEVVRNMYLLQLANQTRQFDLAEIYGAMTRLDYCLALAEAARKWDYTKPEINEDGRVEIIDGWHPIIQYMHTGDRRNQPDPPISNTTRIDLESNLLAVTGPNAGGKSTYLRQLGLTALMAQIGSYVPAKEARITLFDGIFTHFPQKDDIWAKKSTFEMGLEALNHALEQATPRSLLLCDEICQGTDQGAGGEDLFLGIISQLPKTVGITVVATHYRDAVKRAQGTIPALQCAQVKGEFNDDEFNPSYEIIPGISELDYAIDFAASRGLPEGMIAAARSFRNGRP